MDSKAIAAHLEKLYPSPSLHLNSDAQKEIEQLVPKIHEALRGVSLPLVLNILNEPSREYFERTRSAMLGKSLKEYAQTNGGEHAWIAALPYIKGLGEVIKKNDGPFVMGESREWPYF